MATKYQIVRIYETVLDAFSYFRKKFVFRSREGFTLIETIVALAVILAAVVGPVSLISRGIFNFSFSKNKIVAANLAQEGLELTRLIRDNNIICDKLDNGKLDGSWIWNRDPDTGGEIEDPTAAVDADESGFTAITCGSFTLSTPKLLPPTNSVLRIETDPSSPRFGLYNYISGVETIFARRVEIHKAPSGFDPDIPKKDQMDVISTVAWRERGAQNPDCPIFGSRCLTVRERLYNWK